jgi:hypothetical protein
MLQAAVAMILQRSKLVRFAASAALLWGSALPLRATSAPAPGRISVRVSPPVPAVQRKGITGAGFALAGPGSGQVTLFYPNHPDDFGGSTGTGAAVTNDGGASWSALPDDWPVARCADLWADPVAEGRFAALGIRWLPEPKMRGQLVAKDAPEAPWTVAISADGRHWAETPARCQLESAEGVVARPMPHIFTAWSGAWLMPAYVWTKTGSKAVLLQSWDEGKRWMERSTITTSAGIVKTQVPVTTPWLESMVARTTDGSLLAVVRTGSSLESLVVSSRSEDDGLTWSQPQTILPEDEPSPVTGKLPNLLLLPNGMLALLSAHTKFGCRLFLSPDGTGKRWQKSQLITTVSGGNTSMVALDKTTLLVFTPANSKIQCWRVDISAVVQP